MDFNWLVWSNPVTIWWIFLVSVSSINIITWFWTRSYLKGRAGQAAALASKTMVLCSGLYVFGCAFRSLIPRADVQRITLFDTWFASVFVGRTVATIAELGFVFQWAIVLAFVSKETQVKFAALIAKVVVPIIVVAEICSWYAVVTTNYIGNAIEESLWAFTYVLIGLALVSLLSKLKGAMKYAAIIAVAGCGLYVAFMTIVDVPMYLSRLAADTAQGKVYLGFIEGIIDLNSRWVVTHDIAEWKTEIPWMSLYFSFAVWVSLALCYVPLTAERFKKHRVDSNP